MDMLRNSAFQYDSGVKRTEMSRDHAEFAMESLVKSMQKHLSSVTAGAADPRTDNHGFGSGAGNNGHNMRLDLDLNKSSAEKVVWPYSLRSVSQTDDEDEEYDLDTSYPRLNSQFYRSLRQRFPRAFHRKRRHDTLNASLSETSSVCSEVATAMMSSSSRRCQSACTTPRDGNPHGDMGVVGIPRPRSRTNLSSSRFSSMNSLLSDASILSSADRSQRNIAMTSLRQRLKKNQDSWDDLLTRGKSSRRRSRQDSSINGTAPLSSSTPRGDNLSQQRARLRELERSLDNMEAEFGAPVIASKPPVPVSGRRVAPQARRYASPDSHDSAFIDADSASLQSSTLSSLTHRHVVQDPTNRITEAESVPAMIPPPDRFAEPDYPATLNDSRTVEDLSPRSVTSERPLSSDRPSRARSRTPKLRSRGNSPLLHRGPSTSGDSQQQSQQQQQGTRTREQQTPHRHTRDSDADSGIVGYSERYVGPESEAPSLSSTDDDTSRGRGNSARHQGARQKSGPRSESSDKKRDVRFKDEVGRQASFVQSHPAEDTSDRPQLVAPPRPKHKQRQQERSLDSLDSQAPSSSKSKLPWRRNKGSFVPSKETEKIQQETSSRRSSLSEAPTEKPPPLPKQEPPTRRPPSKNKPPPAPKPKLPVAVPPSQNSSREIPVDVIEEPGYARPDDLDLDRPGDLDLAESDPEMIPEMGTDEESDEYSSSRVKSPARRDEGEEAEGTDEVFDPQHQAYQYASVDYRKKSGNEPAVEYINFEEHFNEDRGTPPLPDRGYRSDSDDSDDPQKSSGVFNRMDSLKRSAKKKFSRLRKSLSLEKIDRGGEGGKRNGGGGGSVPPSPTSPSPFNRSPSLRSLTESFGKSVKKLRERKNSGSKSGAGADSHGLTPDQRKPPRAPAGFNRKNPPSISGPTGVDTPTHFRPIGNVRSVNQDGSQVIELKKPPHGPFGFYIARGNASCNHALLVSRLSDGLPEHFFAGLLSVGDEILTINRRRVAQMSLEDVYELMASEDRLVLTVLPYTLRGQT